MPLVSTDTVILSFSPLELPLAGFRLSQPAPLLADQSKMPSPEFHTLNFLLAGLAPPSAPLKLRFDGLNDIVGGKGTSIARFTDTVLGLLSAPGAEMVMAVL